MPGGPPAVVFKSSYARWKSHPLKSLGGTLAPAPRPVSSHFHITMLTGEICMESRPERPLADPLLTETHTDPVTVQNVCLPVFLAHHLKYENLPTSCFLMPPGSLLDATARRRASRRICVGVT